MLKELVNNWELYCTEKNYIGIGSTRKVFRVNDYVIKQHLHPLGFKQSLKEIEIYHHIKNIGLSELFAEVYYVNELMSIQRFYKSLELLNNQTYKLNISSENKLIPKQYNEALKLLDKEFDSFDLKDSGNYGLNKKNNIVFIDYGMTKNIYEMEWVPLAEAGILPQIYYEKCSVCEIEKELRIYGEKDKDKRCYTCGKQ